MRLKTTPQHGGAALVGPHQLLPETRSAARNFKFEELQGRCRMIFLYKRHAFITKNKTSDGADKLSTSFQYRPEIDGLRTLAVCSVIIYHAKFTGMFELPGGFLGVDIFFVISGYLITSIIMKEIRTTGEFSLRTFYARRARRILPVLLLVVFCSLPFAWHFLMPMQMAEFCYSIIASLLFFSNFFWYFAETVYGAESGLIKPFLHTWSLSVEEQFYIFYPLALILLWKKRPAFIPAFFLIGISGGLLLSESVTTRDMQLSFFGTFSRLWELMAGGAIAYATQKIAFLGQRHRVVRFMPSLGLLMIMTFLLLPGTFAHHPGLVTVPVVLGTVLIIAFAEKSEPATRLLSSSAFVRIGLISYSLYLWHYPIFAFGRIISPEPSISTKLFWIALTILLSFISFNLVEKPMRQASLVSGRSFLMLGASSISAVLTFCVVMTVFDDGRSRLSWLEKMYGSRDYDIGTLKRESWSQIDEMPLSYGYENFPGFHARKATDFERNYLWFDTEADGEKVLIVGNSLSVDLFSGLHQNKELFYPRQFARFALRDDFLDSQINQLISSPNFIKADTILVANAYTEASIKALPSFLNIISPFGKKIVLASEPPLFRKIEGYWPYDWYFRKLPEGQEVDAKKLAEISYASLDTNKLSYINEALRDISSRHGVHFLDRLHLLCSSESGQCDSISPDGRRIFTDQHHYSLAGASYVGRKIHTTNWLETD